MMIMSVLMMMMIQLAEYMTRTIPEIIIRFCRMVNISSIKINQQITVLVNYKVNFSIPNVNCHCWYLWDMKLEAFLHPLFNIHGLKLVICLSCCDKWAGIYDDGGSFNIWHSSWAHHSLELSTLTTIRESPFPVSGTQLAQALPVGAWLGSCCMVHCSMWA